MSRPLRVRDPGAGAGVARLMGGAEVAGAVVGVVEVPRCARVDGLVAAGAVDLAGGYLWCPLCAELVVVAVVAALLAGAAGLLVVALVAGAVALSGVEQVGAAGLGTDAAGSWHQRRRNGSSRDTRLSVKLGRVGHCQPVTAAPW